MSVDLSALLINTGLNSRNNISCILIGQNGYLIYIRKRKKKSLISSPILESAFVYYTVKIPAFSTALFCDFRQIAISETVEKAICWIAFSFLHVTGGCAGWLAQKSLACV